MKINRVFKTENVRVEQWVIYLSIEDEEYVSGLGLIEYQMQFGAAQLKTGGICGVSTQEAYRNKGYARRVAEYTTAFMTENGFDVSMVRPILVDRVHPFILNTDRFSK